MCNLSFFQVPGGIQMKKTIIMDLGTRQRQEKEELGAKTKKRFGMIMKQTADELSRKKPDAKCHIVGALVDQHNDEELQTIVNESKKLKDQKKLSPEAAADILTAGNFTRNQQRLIIRGANNEGKKLFPSEQQISVAKKSKLSGFNRDFYEVLSVKLQTKRQGQNKHGLEFCPLVYVKQYSKLLEHAIEKEIDEENTNFKILPDGTKEIEVGIAGDGGGGSVKFVFSLMNKKDGSLTQHVLLIYEAADTLMNAIRCISKISDQVKTMNRAKITVKGIKYTVKQKGGQILIMKTELNFKHIIFQEFLTCLSRMTYWESKDQVLLCHAPSVK